MAESLIEKTAHLEVESEPGGRKEKCPRLGIITLLPERPILFPGGESNWKTVPGSSYSQLQPRLLQPVPWS